MRTCTTLLLLPAAACLLACATAATRQAPVVSGPAAGSSAASTAPSQPSSVSMCTSAQLTLNTDGKDGDFNGMSHSGTLLVLRNTGNNACRLQPFPEIAMLGASGPLKIAFTAPGSRFMHPGPVVLPITVAPGAQVSSALRWVSGPVYANNTCVQPTTVRLRIEAGELTTPLGGTICGDSTKGIEVERSRWQPGTSATGQ